jgi:hypothetical protein
MSGGVGGDGATPSPTRSLIFHGSFSAYREDGDEVEAAGAGELGR